MFLAASTSLVYNGERVSESSPAFTARRKVRDFIVEEKKKEHPRGMGWDGTYSIFIPPSNSQFTPGVMYQLSVREVKLLKAERYIHTAMSKNGFRLVVTMHPQIGMFIHKLLSLNIDYTFKRVKGAMDEWEVVGFLDRFKHRSWQPLHFEFADIQIIQVLRSQACSATRNQTRPSPNCSRNFLIQLNR